MAKDVFDARTTGEHGPGVDTVHFEIPMPQPGQRGGREGHHRHSSIAGSG
ncbi:hypothetical protein [Streptomyces bugieae]|uniref:Uncharacterized protein n=2 Tax=Streptomyces TaxID=1883 RepID=A0ABU7NNX5_9ACTN|nr:hypothetical protein [Streptomyces sp. DSM 41528]